MSRTAAQEKQEVANVIQSVLKKGDTYYIVSRKWWQAWCEYAGLDPNDSTGTKSITPKATGPPGPILNADLAAAPDSPALKKGLVEHEDMEIVNENTWKLIHGWYGGSPTFPRHVITLGMRQQEVIELYPAFLKVGICDLSTGDSKEEAQTLKVVSAQSTLASLVALNAPAGAAGPRQGRVWLMQPKSEGKKDEMELQPLADGSTSAKIEQLELDVGALILLDYKKDDATWSRKFKSTKDWKDFAVNDIIDCKDTQEKWYESTIRGVNATKIQVHFNGWPATWDEWIDKTSTRFAPRGTHTNGPYVSSENSTGSYGLTRQHSSGAPPEKGAVGLRNLGNTCFMNSTLQCLSNTPGLTEYFVEGEYVAHINRDNALGWQGKVADAYGELLKEIWSGNYKTVSPRNFKQIIGEFQPRFSGYQQHDSSELLSFLMDGLHEDLNRVKKKPATSPIDSKGRPDAIVAKESWDNHRLRNQSVIVDMCQGQLKSRVVCPDCKMESITFDPFMFLSVPLPSAGSKSYTVTLFRSPLADGKVMAPTVYSITVPNHGAGADVKAAVSKLAGVETSRLLVTEVWNKKIYKVFTDDVLCNFGARDNIWLYEIPELKSADVISIQVTHHVPDKRDKRIYEIRGYPFVISLPKALIRKMPLAQLRKIVSDAMAPMLKGGWKAGEKDSDLYSLSLLDKEVSPKGGVAHIADHLEQVDLCSQSGSFSIGAIWKSEEAVDRLNVGPFTSAEVVSEGKGKKAGMLTVGDCMETFCKEEILRPTEAWYCSKCKDHKCASKQFHIFKSPNILVVHLKRFSYDRVVRDKLDAFVDFPIEGLDIAEWVVDPDDKKDAIYDLYAVSNHFGGLGGGHYTAYAKNIIDGKWYNLDDSSVSEVDPNRVRTSAAYVLFYRRRSFGKKK